MWTSGCQANWPVMFGRPVGAEAPRRAVISTQVNLCAASGPDIAAAEKERGAEAAEAKVALVARKPFAVV